MKIFEITDTETLHDVFAEVLKQPFFEHNPVDIENVLVHYTDYEPRGGFEKRTLTKRTSPRDTARPIHEYLNYLSAEKFGLNVRSDTLFAYSATHGNQELVGSADYGDRTVVIPVGEYELYYVPDVHDFTDYFNPHYATGKFDFVVSMFRRSGTNVHRAVVEILSILNKEITGQAESEDERLEYRLKAMASDMTHMISDDFSTVFKSESLYTLEEELPDIAKFLVTTVIGQEEFEISDAAKEKMTKIVYWLGSSSVKPELEKYQDYIGAMQKTKTVKSYSDEEYMLYCKEFFIFDYEDFYQYLLKLS